MNKPEYWLRGPIPNISPFLQPAAHALLQSRAEIKKYTKDFSEDLLWEKPAGRASVAFHLQHITGVLDRMLTYAKKKSLTEQQFKYLRNEGVYNEEVKIADLINAFIEKVDDALQMFENTSEVILTEKRTVGRKKLPSSVIGLYFHAAEHSQRHVGQLLVTVSVLKRGSKS
ncbi:DinB family protein [Zunongwangia sp.]|uniref:DinB family protein n=1 Tax=Zunongwangia sp. TaxID=1965325 RepID=UPI003AA8E9A3